MSTVTRPATARIRSTRPLDRAQILAAAALFSTGGAAIKLCSLTGWQVASLRSGIAAVTLLLILPASRRGWSWRTGLVGVSFAATMILYVLANKLTTAANTIFLQGTAPLYILLLSPWLLGERIRRRDLVFMAAMAGGMALFFVGYQPVFSTAPNPMLGNLLAAAAGVSWAVTIMGLRWLGRDDTDSSEHAAAAVACGNLLAFAIALPLAWPVADLRAADGAIISYLGVVQIALAYVFMTRGVRRVPALETSLLLLAEPVLNPLWAWLIHREYQGRWAVVGAVIILGATAAKTWWERGRGDSAAA